MEPKKNLVVVLLKTDHSTVCRVSDSGPFRVFLTSLPFNGGFSNPSGGRGHLSDVGAGSDAQRRRPQQLRSGQGRSRWNRRSQPWIPWIRICSTMVPRKTGQKLMAFSGFPGFFVSNDFRNWLELILWWFQVGIQKSRHRWSSWRSLVFWSSHGRFQKEVWWRCKKWIMSKSKEVGLHPSNRGAGNTGNTGNTVKISSCYLESNADDWNWGLHALHAL